MRKRHHQKIKRYRRSFTGQAERSLVIRRVLGFVFGLIILFGIGWLIAKPGIDFGTKLWYSLKNNLSSDSSSSTSQVQSSSVPQSTSQDESTSQPEPVIPAATTSDGNWAYVALSSIDTAEKASETARELAAQGISCAVVPLKDERGYVYYRSSVALAATSITESPVNMAEIAKALSENGIVPIAYISTFKDPLAPKQDRSLAVTYNGQEGFLWLDNSADRGGNPWLNPYSTGAVDYISQIVSEAIGFGFKNIVLGNVNYPSGYGLTSAGFNAPDDTRTKEKVLADCVSKWQTICDEANVECWFEYPVDAALNNENKLTIVNPFTFNIKNMLIDFSSSVVTQDNSSTIDYALFDAAVAKSTATSTRLAMRASGGTLTGDNMHNAAVAAGESGFSSFIVQ